MGINFGLIDSESLNTYEEFVTNNDKEIDKMNEEYREVAEKKSFEVNDEAGYERFRKLLKAIFTICELSGFHVEGRIEVKDLRTGKIWK